MALSKEPLLRAQKIPRGSHKLIRSRCIAAIDFGTSSLSVAYTTPYDGNIKILPLHSTYERVPNTILIKKDQEGKQYDTIGIGYNAQKIYSSRSRRRGAEKFIYFERIKKILERDKVSSCLKGHPFLLLILILISH